MLEYTYNGVKQLSSYFGRTLDFRIRTYEVIFLVWDHDVFPSFVTKGNEQMSSKNVHFKFYLHSLWQNSDTS